MALPLVGAGLDSIGHLGVELSLAAKPERL